jgi:hypothetical protein
MVTLAPHLLLLQQQLGVALGARAGKLVGLLGPRAAAGAAAGQLLQQQQQQQLQTAQQASVLRGSLTSACWQVLAGLGV